VTNLHHLTTHSTTVLTYKLAIVLLPQICDVISPYVFCSGTRRTVKTHKTAASDMNCCWTTTLRLPPPHVTGTIAIITTMTSTSTSMSRYVWSFATNGSRLYTITTTYATYLSLQ